jgi:hypothetical protein
MPVSHRFTAELRGHWDVAVRNSLPQACRQALAGRPSWGSAGQEVAESGFGILLRIRQYIVESMYEDYHSECIRVGL